ncbi:MAG: hypothetical protein PHV18_07900 [Lachnospiraceae bacterium]|nr:hypothetical protein [Lachnospiraceae bacterium]
MKFRKSKVGIVTALLCLLAVAAVLWFVFRGQTGGTMQGGTLVELYTEEVAA